MILMATSRGVRVSKKDAEKARKLLKGQMVLMGSKKVKHDAGVIFPVSAVEFDLGNIAYEIVTDVFEDFDVATGFEETLVRLGSPFSSYDVIGDIAVLDIPAGFERFEKDIARSLLRSRRHVKTVLKKSSAVEGDERIRRYVHLAGESRTETVHREHGCFFKLDISKVFFSPRLSFERQRICEQAMSGEFIIDMFAGVGPYSIVIAKKKDATIHGYDINKDAIKYFEENIRTNKVSHRVRAFYGSCREAVKGEADRVIMNLPKNAMDFFDTALTLLKPAGGVVHYYAASPRETPFEKEVKSILKCAEKKHVRIKILEKRIVRSYSPGEVHVAIDVGVTL